MLFYFMLSPQIQQYIQYFANVSQWFLEISERVIVICLYCF